MTITDLPINQAMTLNNLPIIPIPHERFRNSVAFIKWLGWNQQTSDMAWAVGDALVVIAIYADV